jgi:hypothetical protein
MDYSKKLKKDYSDIIRMTVYRNQNYEEICFDKYFNKLFPNLDAFISEEIIRNIRNILKQKYGNENDCIRENGILKSVCIKDLKYYQLTAGINGPKNSKINDPVYVVNFNNKSVLLNGYHRILVHMLNNQMTINAYVLAVSE